MEDDFDLVKKLPQDNRDSILGNILNFYNLRKSQKDVSEQELLMRIERVLNALSQFSKEDRQDIYNVLDIITQGQLLELERFVFYKKTGEVLALETEDDLDDYTYRVAGCVGEFWTRICRRHLYPYKNLNEELF